MGKELQLRQVKQSTMIYQSNLLIDAPYRLSLPGKRVLAMALGIVGNADVKPKGASSDEFPYLADIRVADYAAIFDVPLVNASQDVYEGIMTLAGCVAKIYHPGKDSRKRGDFRVVPFTYAVDAKAAHTDKGRYCVELHPELLEFVGLLEHNFTQYDLLHIGQLKENQWRLYEQLAKHKTHGKKAGVNYGSWITSFEFFTGDYFDIGESIKAKPAEMKRRFLDTALDTINEQTDLFIEFEDNRKQWLFKIFSGDLANKKREAWRKEKVIAELKAKEERRLARLRKKMEAEAAEDAE